MDFSLFVVREPNHTTPMLLKKNIQFTKGFDSYMLSRKRILPLFFLILMAASCSGDDPDPDGGTNSDTNTEGQTDNGTDNSSDNTGDLIFVQTYGGSQEDTFHDVINTTDGGFAALGYSQSVDGDITDNPNQINKYWVVKTDTNGNIQWSRTYGGSDDDRGEQLIQTTDGGYALIGYSKSNDGDVASNQGLHDHWVVKLDASGSIQWQRSYGFPGSDQAFSIVQTSDGGYFSAGFLDVTASGGAGNEGRSASRHGVGEFWAHKLDSNGELLWRRYYGGTNNDRAYAALETDDGNLLLVGSSESDDFDISDPKGSYDFWAVLLDNQGTLLWERNYGGSEIEVAYAALPTPDGNYLLVGDTRSSDGDISTLQGSADVWVVKINGQGDLLWERTYGGSGFDSARDVAVMSDGFVITGASRSADGNVSENKGQSDFWTLKIDFNGNLQWQRVTGGAELDFGYGVAVASDGSIMVAGDTQSNDQDISLNSGVVDAVLIKLQ